MNIHIENMKKHFDKKLANREIVDFLSDYTNSMTWDFFIYDNNILELTNYMRIRVL